MTVLVQSRPSNGATALVRRLRSRDVRALLRGAGATSRLRRSSFLVNWGVSDIPVGDEGLEPHLNHQNNVYCAVDKSYAFHVLKESGVSVPEFLTATPSEDTSDGQGIWLARHTLTGSGGKGITVVRPGDVFPSAPMYVQYIPKLVEFRVHVFRQLNGYDTLVRQKLRQSTAYQTMDQRLIRNHDNGWVFGNVRDEDGADKAKAAATKAVEALGLNFGAVDVIIGRDDGVAYVLEINTAPGLTSDAALDFYTDNIIAAYNCWRNDGSRYS